MLESSDFSWRPRASAVIMEDQIDKILKKLEGLDRLEKKIDNATSKMSEDLDVTREEILEINEGRRKDNTEILEVKKTLTKIQNDTIENTTLHKEIITRVTNIDNRSNENTERIK